MKAMKRVMIAAAVGMALAGCGGKEERISQHFQRGTEHLTAGDTEKARVEFKNVLQMEPKHVPAMVSMARVLEQLDDTRGAARFYQAAIELDGTQTDAKRRLARLFVVNGGVDPAANLADELLAQDPADSAALAVRGAVKVARGDRVGAEADARAAVARDPDSVDAVMLLASLFNGTDRAADALTLLNTARERHPKDVSIYFVLGDTYQKLGRYDDAAKQLQEIIALEPTQLTHRLRLAKFYASLKRPDDAEAVLRAAVESNPESTEAKLALVDFLTRTKSVDVGRQQLEQLVAGAPDDAELHLGQARFYQSIGKADESKKVYRELVERYQAEPTGLRARTELARQLASEGAADQVQTLLNDVLKENPKDRDALLLRGNLALRREDADGAIADFRAVLRDDPASVPVLKALARAHTLNGEIDLAKDTYKKALSANVGDVESHVELGTLYSRTGQQTDAIFEFEQARKLEPKNVALMEGLFKAYVAGQQWDKAESIVADMRAAYPKSAAPDFLVGVLAQAQNNPPAAEKAYRAALEITPEFPDALAALVKLLTSDRRAPEALAFVEKTIKQQPTSIPPRTMRAELLLAMGKENTKKAIAEAEYVLTLDPKNVGAYRLIALAHSVHLGDKAGAVAAYRKGIAATGGSVPLQMGLAALYEQNNDLDDAIATYEQLLKDHPGAELAANNLAMLLVAHRADDASVKRAADLVEPLRKTENAAVLDTIGWVDYRRGQYNAAVPTLEKALKTAPGSALVRYHLGMAQYKQGNHAAAKEQLQQALASPDQFHGRDEASSTLQSLAQM